MRQKSKSPLYCIKSSLPQNFLPCLHPVAQLQCFSCSNSRGQQLSTTVKFTDTSRSSCETAFKFTNATNYNNIPQRFTSFLHLTRKWNKTNKHTNFSVISTSVPVIILNTHTHTRLTALFPGLLGWAGTRKVKPIWILLKQETVSGSGISWAICKSARRSRQITTPAPHHSRFLQAGCPSV